MCRTHALHCTSLKYKKTKATTLAPQKLNFMTVDLANEMLGLNKKIYF
jgi:hypothetical protein